MNSEAQIFHTAVRPICWRKFKGNQCILLTDFGF